jgi:hypothetical protein
VDSCNGNIFGGVRFFKTKPYAEKIIRKAASLAPWHALSQLDEYKDQGFAKSIIETAASQSPKSVLKDRELIKAISYGSGLIQKAESQIFESKDTFDMCFIWEHYELFSDTASVRKALRKVNEKDCLEKIRRRDD